MTGGPEGEFCQAGARSTSEMSLGAPLNRRISFELGHLGALVDLLPN
jgi:hypothetical protein